MNESITKKIRRLTKEKIDNLEVWDMIWEKIIDEIDAEVWLIYIYKKWEAIKKWKWLDYNEVFNLVFEDFLNDYIDDLQDKWVAQNKS